VELQPVDEGNWQAVVAVRPAPGQERFVAPAAFYLCLSHYEGHWHPLAIYGRAGVVGHVLWACDPHDGSHWIGGLVIDATVQRRGLGRAAVVALLDRFRAERAPSAALSYAPENAAARALYRALGFRETGERSDGELVARLVLG
jgi:diamine N-acetyltransferase